MVAEDFLRDPQVRQWLDGVEPAWTQLTFESLCALQQEPSAVQTAIRIANDLSADEIAGSAVVRNTLILLRQAIERGGLPLTATGNMSRAVVAEMRELIKWPGDNQADAFRLHKVINEPDFLPLHIVRLLAEAAKLVRIQRGKLVATPFGGSMLSDVRQGSLPAILFHLTFWHMDLGYFGRGLLGSWPQRDAGVVLWSLSVCANDWQSSEKLTRLCTIPEPAMFSGTWDRTPYSMEARILQRCSGSASSTIAGNDSRQPARRGSFLSQGGLVRSTACVQRRSGFDGRCSTLKAVAEIPQPRRDLLGKDRPVDRY
jgi:hypothetical protein